MVSSSIARKFVMAVTGLFLIGFLLAHLSGNLLLLKGDGGQAFNEYAHFMKHNPLIILGEIVLALGFLFHIVQGIQLIFKNKAARPVAYAYKDNSETQSTFSKYMGPLGMLILVMLLWHLYDFFAFKYTANLRGGIDMIMVNGVEIPDLATIVYTKFTSLSAVVMYLVFCALVAFHLHHGFQSAFQSLGMNHKKYSPIIKKAGAAYAIIIPLIFALIPVLIYVGV